MRYKGIGYFVVLAGALLVGVTFASPAEANCGGGTPCVCGDNLTASRTLTNDPILSTPCTGNGLTITVNGVVLDMNGNKIVGRGAGTGILIAADNVTITDGGVDNFETGIGTDGVTSQSIIDSIRPNANTGDGILLVGDNNELTGILAKRNGANGVKVVGSNNILQGHNDEYNGIDGIRVEGHNNELIANLASENAKKGQGNGITVIGNGNTLERNRMTKLNINGIAVTGDDNILEANQVTKQRSDGFVVRGADNDLINNRATDNRGVGFDVTGGGNAAGSTGNVVRNNRTDPQCSIDGVTIPPTCITK